MKVSVIIPTYNGGHKILNLLRSLEQQTNCANEILVIVDGSTDSTVEWLLKQQQLSGIKIIQQENQGRAIVRNNGAKAANGDLLIFFDDDMRPTPDCIEKHIQHHLQFKSSILTGAQIDPRDDNRSDFQKFKGKLSLKWSAAMTPYKTTPLAFDQAYITAANFSIPKTLFDELGGFDERLTDAEDYDLAVRAQRAGVSLYYNHDAFAWHDDRVTCKTYIRRMRQYNMAHKKLEQLKPDLYPGNSKYSITKPKGIKGVFFRLFCHRLWISSVDKGFWKWMPEKYRYRLYDWIITANGSFFPDEVVLM